MSIFANCLPKIDKIFQTSHSYFDILYSQVSDVFLFGLNKWLITTLSYTLFLISGPGSFPVSKALKEQKKWHKITFFEFRISEMHVMMCPFTFPKVFIH